MQKANNQKVWNWMKKTTEEVIFHEKDYPIWTLFWDKQFPTATKSLKTRKFIKKKTKGADILWLVVTVHTPSYTCWGGGGESDVFNQYLKGKEQIEAEAGAAIIPPAAAAAEGTAAVPSMDRLPAKKNCWWWGSTGAE